MDDVQVAEAADEINAIIGEVDAYDVAYATVVEPAAEARVDAVGELPYGIVLTRTDVLASLRATASPAWVEREAAMLAGSVSAYLTGQTEGFTAALDLVPLKADVASVLTAMAAASLRDTLRGLPECSTAAESAKARAMLRRELPACIPSGLDAADIVDMAVPVLSSSIDESVLDRVPDMVQYTEQDLRDALSQDDGPEVLEVLDDIREFFIEGWTYSDADLRADLSDDEDAIETSAESREWASWVRRGRWIGGLAAGILLVAVAFLGGRSWRGRVAWAAAVLLVSAGVAALVSGPLYQAASGAVFDAVREGLADPDSKFPLTSELLANKLPEVIEMVADEFMGDIARNSLILAVVAAGPLLASLFWERIAAAAGRAQP